jgi:Transposase DDE domain
VNETTPPPEPTLSPRPSPPPLKSSDILCLGHLRRVFALLDRLHDVGCKRDTAGNRELFFDGYCKLLLLYIWNPLIDSLRCLQEASALASVAKALGVKRFSVGSFSEAPRVFEPDRLKPIIEELAGELRPLAGKDPRLSEVEHTLTLVDGTVLPAIAHLARAAISGTGGEARYSTSRDGRAQYGWRLHTQLDLDTFNARIDRTGARNAGKNRENNVLRAHLEPGRCYVGDGGYADRSLFNDIVAADSCYVIRLQDNAVFDVAEERLLSQAALDANVVRDCVVQLGSAQDRKRDGCMNHAVRIVEVKVTPHPRRTRMGTRQTDRLILVTNLLDLPAQLIALIYLQRYTVELFFRIFKQLLGLRHLLSHKQEGIDIQIHCTVIVCLLLCLITGKKPTQSNRNMIGWFLIGVATEQELIDHLNKPDNTGIKKRAKDELWKKLGV